MHDDDLIRAPRPVRPRNEADSVDRLQMKLVSDSSHDAAVSVLTTVMLWESTSLLIHAIYMSI